MPCSRWVLNFVVMVMEQSVLRDSPGEIGQNGPVVEGTRVVSYSGSSAGLAKGIQNTQVIDSGRITSQKIFRTSSLPNAFSCAHAALMA